MKVKQIIILIFSPFVVLSQEVVFEKPELNITVDSKPQTILVKVIQKDPAFNSDITVHIKSIEGTKVQLNPREIEYCFKKDGVREFVFPIFLNFNDIDNKNKFIELLEISYTKTPGGLALTKKLLIVNILPFQEKKSLLPDDFPNTVIFLGTNIDPLGVNKVTSSSMYFERNFKFHKKLGFQFGVYTHQITSVDSLEKGVLLFSPNIDPS